jgi:geranylgeranyl diphosphate synthase, type II
MAAIIDADSFEKKRGGRSRTAEDNSRVRFWRSRLDAKLIEHLRGETDSCPTLVEAMRYSLLAPGKRVRPLLAMLTAIDFGRDPEPMLDFGCALEFVHCASLMLDDLPCMDDARMRRGQLAAHIRFGEATTMLAAVGLLNQAYAIISASDALAEAIRCRLVAQLSHAVGTAGLVSGQSRDLCERRCSIDSAGLRRINRQKTGVMFELAVVGGGTIADLPVARLETLNRFAGHLGQAFQIADDLCDCQRHRGSTGKDCGLDVDKAGSVHQLGEAALRERLLGELECADAQIVALDIENSLLRTFVRSLFQRLL